MHLDNLCRVLLDFGVRALIRHLFEHRVVPRARLIHRATLGRRIVTRPQHAAERVARAGLHKTLARLVRAIHGVLAADLQNSRARRTGPAFAGTPWPSIVPLSALDDNGPR